MFAHTANARLPTEFGIFTIHLFTDGGVEIPVLAQLDHIESFPVIRVHSSCATGDIFHSLRCDCGEQLKQAMQMIQTRGGLLIYLPQEGRGIGLTNKIKAYALQDKENLDTVDANLKLGLDPDARTYELAIKIINFFDITQCILLTNNPDKVEALKGHGIYVKREALQIQANPENTDYLQIKRDKMGHLF